MKNPFKGIENKIRGYFLLRQVKKRMQPVNEGKRLVYTDKFENKWYTLNNPANLHGSRTLTAWLFSKDIEFGMNAETRKKLRQIIRDAINVDGPAQRDAIGSAIDVMEAGENLWSEPEILLNLATCYTFLNDEGKEYKDFEQEKKRYVWENDNDCKGFFFHFACNYIDILSESQKSNVLQYLDKTKPVRDQIRYVIKKYIRT